MPRLPKTIYVTEGTVGHDKFLFANKNLFEIIEDDGSETTYGVYQLAETKKAKKVVQGG